MRFPSLALIPDENDSPYGRMCGSASNIPAIDFAGPYRSGGTMQFQPGELHVALRYLRELAAVATDLADQVQTRLEDETVKAVLES